MSQYYNQIAYIYDQSRYLTPEIAEEIAAVILNVVSAQPTTTFLEPGVGTGINMYPFVERGYSVTGIDPSAEMLAEFCYKVKNPAANLTLVQRDATYLPFSKNSFDVVLTMHMIHLITDWQDFLNEVRRVLNPSGTYLFCQNLLPSHRQIFEQQFRTMRDTHCPPSQETANTSAGLAEVSNYFAQFDIAPSYHRAAEWMVSESVQSLLSHYWSKAFGSCWAISDDQFPHLMQAFEDWCLTHYGSLDVILSSTAIYEIYAFPQKTN